MEIEEKRSDCSTWQVGPNYKCSKIIGSGSYGNVAEAVHVPTGVRVAIKRTFDLFDDEDDCKKIVRELQLLREIKSSLVINILDIIEPVSRVNFNHLYVVMNFVDADLKKLVKAESISLTDAHIKQIMY